MRERSYPIPTKLLVLLALSIVLAGCDARSSATAPTSTVISQPPPTLATMSLATRTAPLWSSSVPAASTGSALPVLPLPPATIPTPTPNPTFVRMVNHWPVTAGPPIAWSPDGRSLLLGSADYELVHYPLDGGNPVTLLAVREGKLSFDQIRATWDHRANAIVTPRGEPDGSFAIVAFSPEGSELRRFVAGVASDNWWSSMRRNLLEEANRAPLSIFDVAIASDGTVGVLGAADVLRMRLGQPDEQVALPAEVRAGLDAAPLDVHRSLWLAPAGGRLAVTVDARIFLFGPQSGDPLTLVELPDRGLPEQQLPLSLAWSPDGARLAVEGVDVSQDIPHFVRYTYVVDQASGSLRAVGADLPYVTGNDRVVDAMTWSPDGRWLLLGRGSEAQCDGGPYGCLASQTVQDVEKGGAAMLWLAPGGPDVGVWSPDGRQIAVYCAHKGYSAVCVLSLAPGWETALQEGQAP